MNFDDTHKMMLKNLWIWPACYPVAFIAFQWISGHGFSWEDVLVGFVTGIVCAAASVLLILVSHSHEKQSVNR